MTLGLSLALDLKLSSLIFKASSEIRAQLPLRCLMSPNCFLWPRFHADLLNSAINLSAFRSPFPVSSGSFFADVSLAKLGGLASCTKADRREFWGEIRTKMWRERTLKNLCV